VFWTYVLATLFVADIARVLLTAVAPGAVPLLDYRVVFWILVVVLVFWRGWLPQAIYVAGLPLLICVIWIPWRLIRFFWQHRSWGVFLGMLQVAATLLRDFRYNVMTKALAVVAAILIIFTPPSALTWISATYLALLMALSFLRRIRQIFLATSFVGVQEKFIASLMNWGWLQRAQVLSEANKLTGIEKYNSEQAQQVVSVISLGVGLNKALYLWAYQLGRYRRRFSPSLVFNLVSLAWVFVAALTSLTLLNIALLKIAPDQYIAPSWGPISPIVYSLGTFWLADAGGIRPVGQMAYLLQLAGAVTGGLLLISFGLSALLAYFRDRDDTAIQQLIDDLKDQARRQEARFQAEYHVSIDEAYEKLCALGANYAGILTFLIDAMPPDFHREGRPDQGPR